MAHSKYQISKTSQFGLAMHLSDFSAEFKHEQDTTKAQEIRYHQALSDTQGA